MKSLITLAALALLLCLTACNEQKTINTIRTGQTVAATGGQAVYAALGIAHQTGNLSDANWTKFLGIWARYQAADKLLADALATWESGVNRPPLDRIIALFQNLNLIIEDLNQLIAAWHVKAELIPPLRC